MARVHVGGRLGVLERVVEGESQLFNTITS
jgi:hypothetical protein